MEQLVVCGARRASLCTLPLELFDYIVSISYDLDPASVLTLRLAGTRRDDLIVRHLFRRVGLSALKSSREAFLGITSRPHLARHVRELIWYDLPYTSLDAHWERLGREDNIPREPPTEPPSPRKPFGASPRPLPDVYPKQLQLHALLAEACWMHNLPVDSAYDMPGHWQAVFDEFREWFLSALQAPPLLDTVTTRVLWYYGPPARDFIKPPSCLVGRDPAIKTIMECGGLIAVVSAQSDKFIEFITWAAQARICAAKTEAPGSAPRKAQSRANICQTFRGWPRHTVSSRTCIGSIREDAVPGSKRADVRFHELDESAVTELVSLLCTPAVVDKL
ncbi:uncharacterized protein B0I36DRAFT_369404 [Microdochium trichocladiopsis]|uniref:F-box domain-containing protein n=1 Tax=Microdochium trichocladiopsis TaxID=1682393 RepID=A0A9P9BIJ1_9PEZI|nr:uncharacterized protein B0I36DRAFT_369404 [Microdochium trichocladiopsis]KAH7014448.1 hypothetical protein B0I36DRAFT_369404 [Microdochium trichocladiopsis]